MLRFTIIEYTTMCTLMLLFGFACGFVTFGGTL